MKLTVIFCVFLFAAGSHGAIKNKLDLYPEFKQLQDKVNSNSVKITQNTNTLNGHTTKINSNSLRLQGKFT